MEPANCMLVIFPGAVGFEVVLGMLRVLRLMDSANCELVILPGAVGFEVVLGVLGVLRVLGVATALLFDECCCVVLRLMDPTNGVWVVSTALLFDEPCGVEKSCRVAALEVARALRCDGNPD